MNKLLSSIALAAILVASSALAQSTVLDQTPAPAPAPGNTKQQSELLTQSIAVAGGTLYVTTLKQGGPAGAVVSVSSSFVPVAAGGLARYMPIAYAKSDAGVGLTATATAGAMGIARTAGTSFALAGEATSASAKTDTALWNLDLADSYVANADIPVVVNANYTGSGTITGASTTLAVAAYTEVNGVETALTVSAAQQFTGTAANYTFTITGAGLTPGAAVTVEITMLVTSASGANTGHVNSVALTM